jgi:hypothetical protein
MAGCMATAGGSKPSRATMLSFLCILLACLIASPAGAFLVSPASGPARLVGSTTKSTRAHGASAAASWRSAPPAARRAAIAPTFSLGIRMGESFYETDINAKGLLRRMAAASIYNRMAQQARSSAMSASSTSESSSAAEAEDRRPADAAEGAGAGASAEKEDPMAKLEREMRKLDPKSKVVKKDGANKLRHRNDYRKPGDWSKKSKDEGGSKVEVAFNAFANSLLRTGQGKVRSFTIWSAFRQEFPSLSQETKVTNQTLGRKLSAWYMDAAGEPLNKIPGGSYGGLSIINPRFTSTDLTELRAAQALFEPNMKRKFETLGIGAGGAERGLAGGARKFEERQNRRRERTKQEGRVEVQKDRNGRVIRVVRRADPDKGITEKVLSGKPFPQPTNRVSELKKISPTVKMCVEAFANTMLTASPEGRVTFDDIKAAFTGQFPLLSSSDRMTDSFLGRAIVEWYKAKFDKPLVRKKTVEMAQQPCPPGHRGGEHGHAAPERGKGRPAQGPGDGGRRHPCQTGGGRGRLQGCFHCGWFSRRDRGQHARGRLSDFDWQQVGERDEHAGARRRGAREEGDARQADSGEDRRGWGIGDVQRYADEERQAEARGRIPVRVERG